MVFGGTTFGFLFCAFLFAIITKISQLHILLPTSLDELFHRKLERKISNITVCFFCKILNEPFVRRFLRLRP